MEISYVKIIAVKRFKNYRKGTGFEIRINEAGGCLAYAVINTKPLRH
jgi:hypothetical protein